MKRKHKKLVVIAILICFLIFAPSTRILPSPQVAIVRAADITVTINTAETIGTNQFQNGFQLDYAISYFKGSSIGRGYAETANYKLVRFFEHKLGKPCTYWNEGTKTGTWDWDAIDDLIDKIFAVGAEPFMVLGFYSPTYQYMTSCPSGMTTDYDGTGLPEPAQFAEYAKDWVEHFDNRGTTITYWEIFNEPFQYHGWGGSNTTKRGYFGTFFNAVANAMKTANANIKIGNDNSMIQSNDYNEWVANNLVQLDFLSWHAYLTGSLSTSNSTLIYKAEYDEGGTYGANDFIEPARQDYYNIRGVWLDVIQGEANLNYAWSGGQDPRMRAMLNAVTEGLRYRTYILNGHVTHNIYFHFAHGNTGYFGMVNRYSDLRYYPYWLHYIMFSDELGALSVNDDILYSSSTLSSLDPLVWKHEDTTNILLIHSSTSLHSVALSGVSGTYAWAKINNTASAIQTGTMDVANEISFNGYTVMLLQQEDGGTPDNPPSSSDILHNTTIADDPIEFSCNWTDDNDLSTYAFSTNNTGTWVNQTDSLTGTQDWANVTATLNSTSSVVVQYRWYCNDSENQWTVTPIYSLVTQASNNVPVYSDVGTTSNINGSSCKFFVKWTDIEGLSGFIFGTNNTGSWENETWTSLTGVEDWGEETKTLNETVGIVIQWQVWCNDTDGHWTETEDFFLITEEEVTENLLFFESKSVLDYNTELEDDGYPFLTDSNGTIKALSYGSYYLTFTISAPSGYSYTFIDTSGNGEPVYVTGGSYTYNAITDILTVTVTHSSDEEIGVGWIGASGEAESETDEYTISLNTPFPARDVDVTEDGVLYAVDWEGNAWSSSNNGSSWTLEVSTETYTAGYAGVDIDSAGTVHVFWGSGGIWRKTSTSSTWEQTFNSSLHWGAWHFAENPFTGDLYLQVHSSLIYNSTDGGATWQIFFNLTESSQTDDHLHAIAWDSYTDTLWVATGDTNDTIRRWDSTNGWVIVNVGHIQPTSIMFDEDYAYFGPDAMVYLYRLNKSLTMPVEDDDFEMVLNLGREAYPGNHWMWECKKIGDIYYAPTNYDDGIFFVSVDGIHWVVVFNEDGEGLGVTKGGIPAFSNRLPIYFVHNAQIYRLDVSFNDIIVSYNQPFITETSSTITWERSVENGDDYLNIGEIEPENINLTFTGLSIYDIIENRTFETGDDGGWTEDGYGEIALTNSEAHGGSWSLNHTIYEGVGYTSVVYPPEMEDWNKATYGNGQYFFSAWVKTNVSGSIQMFLDYQDDDGTSYWWRTLPEVNTTWQQFVTTMFIPEDATAIRAYFVVYRESGVPREVYYDDVMVWGPLKYSYYDTNRQRFIEATYTNDWDVTEDEKKTINPNVTIAGATYSHSGALNNGSVSTEWQLDETYFEGGIVAFNASIANSTQVLMTVTAYTRHLVASITNMEGCGNWLFVNDEAYDFRVDYPFNASDELELVKVRFQDEMEQTVIAEYDVTTDTYGLETGTDFATLEGVTTTVEYTSGELRLLRVTFSIRLKSSMVDTWYCSILVYGKYESGLSLGWRTPSPDYFNIYNLGGHSTETSSGNAGRLPGGDVFDLYAYNQSWTKATLAFRNLQHFKILPMVHFKLSGDVSPYFELTYQVEYCVDDVWLEGYKIKMRNGLSGYLGTGNERHVGVYAQWYNDDVLIKTDIVYFYHTATTDKNTTYQYWLDLWFNKGNASSIVGGRVNAYYFPMQNEANEWLQWLTGNDWGANETKRKQSMFFESMIDNDEEIIHTEEIEMIRVSFLLNCSITLYEYCVTISDHDVFDLTIGGDPFTGISTPVFDETKIPIMPQGGFLGTLVSWFQGAIKWLSDNLMFGGLNLWGNFVGFMDTIAAWLGFPGGFSSLIASVTTFWAWLTTSFGYLTSMLVSTFSFLAAFMTKLINTVSTAVGIFTDMINQFFFIIGSGYGYTVGTWEMLGMTWWITIFFILYPLFLLGMWEERGLDAVISHINGVKDILAFIGSIFIRVIQLTLNIIGRIIESIPVVE